jgi:hypothetical protein
MIHRAAAALMLTLVLAGLPAASAQAGPRLALDGTPVSARTSVSVVHDGLRLTLKIPQRSYPRNALVQVRLTLTNITSQSIDLGAQNNGNGFCTTSLPQAEVRNTRGKLLFPPAVAPLIVPPCPFYLGRPLAAGQSLVNREYVILRGRVLTGIASTRTGQSFTPFSTPPLPLSLTHESAPTTTETAPPAGIDIHSLVPVTGQFRYASTWICPSGTSNGIRTGWTAVQGTHINPPCPAPSRWNVAAGWLGHPVVGVHYSHGQEPALARAVQGRD